MIISCPNCRKQISSKADVCPHCEFARGEISDEQLTEFARRKLRDRIYHLKMWSYGAFTVALAAFGWYWYASSTFQRPATFGPILLLALAAVGYLVIRVLLFAARRNLRQLN